MSTSETSSLPGTQDPDRIDGDNGGTDGFDQSAVGLEGCGFEPTGGEAPLDVDLRAGVRNDNDQAALVTVVWSWSGAEVARVEDHRVGANAFNPTTASFTAGLRDDQTEASADVTADIVSVSAA